MGFLTEDELGNLSIERMILHVVGANQEFEPQSEIVGTEHVEFFVARIQDAAASPVHSFNANSTTKSLLEEIAQGSVAFEEGAQELSRRFAKDHSGNSSPGAFFVIELGTGDQDVRLFSLIKYDYRQAVELREEEGRKELRRIVQAFVREKKAIQKACLVRIRSGVAEEAVSATDRMASSPDLTGYFQAFLDVGRARDNSELSGLLNEAIRKTAQECKAILPDGDVVQAIERIKEVLRGQENVHDDAIRDAVFVAAGRPEDEETKRHLEKKLTSQLKRVKLDGVTFRPDQAIFRRKPRRKIRTEEGVLVEFPGEQENRAVTKEAEPEGGWKITIRTRTKFVEDATISSKAS